MSSWTSTNPPTKPISKPKDLEDLTGPRKKAERHQFEQAKKAAHELLKTFQNPEVNVVLSGVEGEEVPDQVTVVVAAQDA